MSASKKTLNTDHKTRVENCKGRLVDLCSTYGKWAYWYGDKCDGWHAQPKPGQRK